MIIVIKIILFIIIGACSSRFWHSSCFIYRENKAESRFCFKMKRDFADSLEILTINGDK